MSLSRLSRLVAARVTRLTLLSAHSQLPIPRPHTSGCIHIAAPGLSSEQLQEQPAVTLTTLASSSLTSSTTPLRTSLATSPAATTPASSHTLAPSTDSLHSAHAWAASFSTDTEAMRRADEEFVLGLFGASHQPSEASVRQKRQQLSSEQQTASQFAGTEATRSASTQPASSQNSTQSAADRPQRRENKAESKAEARKDRDQGEFDQAGQRVTPVSASQSVRDMDDARHKQSEQTEEGARSGADDSHTPADSDAVAQAQKRRQTAPPRPLDDRRPGGEKSDPAAPWSE